MRLRLRIVVLGGIVSRISLRLQGSVGVDMGRDHIFARTERNGVPDQDKGRHDKRDHAPPAQEQGNQSVLKKVLLDAGIAHIAFDGLTEPHHQSADVLAITHIARLCIRTASLAIQWSFLSSKGAHGRAANGSCPYCPTLYQFDETEGGSCRLEHNVKRQV